LTDITSNAGDGQQWTDFAARPSRNGTVVIAWLPESCSPASSTSEAGSSYPAPTMPRGRWYLKLRAVRRTPLASKAEARVSP
jgi:hypothetical protein